MSADTPLATPKDVKDLLHSLVGREVEVYATGKMQDPAVGDGNLVGVYTDNRMALSGIVLLDVPLGAYVGAALGLVPVRLAQQAANHGGLPDNLLENASEVLNVMSALFNADGAPHVRLDTVYEPGHPLPADVAQWVAAFVPRCDLDVEVAGYGRGGFSLLVL
ncbi:hypothetical protein Cch01nite_33780 [Cellulomonas chitinilytica]|uniref:Uncharacterized protein n=1 Tax=Cellulomonas chitinilytica TaxID=398759 RepID=A0A919P7E5_9CELL|nr:hypothetical protein [Cellulomonas chitinilytica]GIG22654.1 hypothetical protein Cch01nite_33780 [Cellulomonas chitinilytica]